MRPRTVLVGSFLIAGVLTGCGDDDPTSAEASDTAETPTDGSASDGGDTVTVEIGDFVFDPEPVELTAGQSIVWENVHDQAHTASSNGDADFDTGSLAPDASSDPVPFEEPGTFTYICALHPFMEGTVEVSA